MNGRVTLGMVALLIILGGYIYFFERDRDVTSSPTGAIPLYGKTYGEYDIVELEIESPQGQAMFARTDENLTRDWQMVSPNVLNPAELDQVRVNGAATRLGRLTAEQVITNVTNLKQYGLAPPLLTATLTLSNGQKVVLHTGSETPLNDNRYVQTAAAPEAVYVIFGLAVDELHHLIATPPVAPTPLPTITPRPAAE